MFLLYVTLSLILKKVYVQRIIYCKYNRFRNACILRLKVNNVLSIPRKSHLSFKSRFHVDIFINGAETYKWKDFWSMYFYYDYLCLLVLKIYFKKHILFEMTKRSSAKLYKICQHLLIYAVMYRNGIVMKNTENVFKWCNGLTIFRHTFSVQSWNNTTCQGIY